MGESLQHIDDTTTWAEFLRYVKSHPLGPMDISAIHSTLDDIAHQLDGDFDKAKWKEHLEDIRKLEKDVENQLKILETRYVDPTPLDSKWLMENKEEFQDSFWHFPQWHPRPKTEEKMPNGYLDRARYCVLYLICHVTQHKNDELKGASSELKGASSGDIDQLISGADIKPSDDVKRIWKFVTDKKEMLHMECDYVFWNNLLEAGWEFLRMKKKPKTHTDEEPDDFTDLDNDIQYLLWCLPKPPFYEPLGMQKTDRLLMPFVGDILRMESKQVESKSEATEALPTESQGETTEHKDWERVRVIFYSILLRYLEWGQASRSTTATGSST